MTGSPEFEEIAGELYGLRPDEFIAARDERMAEAKAAGQRELARELGKLRRPTQTAWLINQLWRDQQEQVEELLALTDEFGAAMAAGDGKRLQSLTVTRRELEGRLVQRAGSLAAEAELPASADTLREVQETLGAALVSVDAAGEVRSGRLVRPLTYSGFGPGFAAVGQAATATPSRRGERAKPKSRKATAAETDEHQAAAQRELGEAQQEMSDAEQELAERSRAAERANDDHATLSKRLAELREHVREIDQQVMAAKQIAVREQRRHEQAEKAYERARAAVERAEKRLRQSR
ncbi:MAG TPA: hypothetical protein VFZ85_05725 [Jiangellaceae bacterium]